MLSITFDPMAWDKNTLPVLRQLKIALSKQTHDPVKKTVLIDFEKTAWCEPTSLLVLSNILKNNAGIIDSVVFRLGDVLEEKRGKFLTFLSRQGFLLDFPDSSIFEFSVGYGSELKRLNKTDTDFLLQDLPSENAFQQMDAVSAQTVSIAKFREDEGNLVSFVEELVSEARVKTDSYTFRLNAFEKDRYFHRLRKFLFEALLNCSEHAYLDGKGYASVFARVRQGIPLDASVDFWHKRHREEELNAVAIEYRELNLRSEWIEVFVCDTGEGILSTTSNWPTSARNVKEQKAIERALAARNPLASLGRLLFQAPVTRYGKERGHRTSETGLLEIARTLNQGGGYMRILDGFEGIGGQFPWQHPNIASGQITDRRQTADGNLGTCLCLTYQPQSEIQPTASEAFSQPTERDVGVVLEQLQSLSEEPKPDYLYDRRFAGSGRPMPDEVGEMFNYLSRKKRVRVIVRLPKSATKRDIGHWINDLDDKLSPTTGEVSIVFVDVRGFHAELLVSFFESIRKQTSSPIVQEIIVVTIGYEVAHLKFSRRRYRSLPNSDLKNSFWNSRKNLLCSVAASLKEIDSRAFWRESTISPISSFLELGKVHWPSSTLPPKDYEFEDYIDFAHALVDPARYRTCKRALTRILLLLRPNSAMPTDDLVGPLLNDIEEEYDPANQVETTLIVSSVNITGSTVDRYKNRQRGRGCTITAFFDRGVDIRKQVVPLLHWKPPSTPDERGELQRVSGTAFVSKDGDYSISVNRMYLSDDNEYLQPYYPRTPDESYSDFATLNGVVLAHRETSLRHELLGLDTRRIIDRIQIDGDRSWKWLYGKIDVFLNEGHENWAVVFPNSGSVNAIVQGYLGRRDDAQEIAQRFLPVSFLRQRVIEPYLISPLLADKLGRLFEQNEQTPRVLILDSTTFSGNTLRQINQLVQNCSLKAAGKTAKVQTLALIDRSGFPVYGGVMASFFERHSRYWRWDVPHLGAGENCTLCSAIGRASSFSDSTRSLAVKNTIENWTGAWRSSQNGRQKALQPEMNFQLPEPISIKFGVFLGGDREKSHKVRHTGSLTLVSNLMELTRLTHRADIALRWAMKFSDNSPMISLQILSVSLFLFSSSFRYWERFAYYRLLMSILAKLSPELSEKERPTVALACLALLLISEEMLNDLEEIHLDRLISSTDILNPDVCVSMSVLFAGRKYEAAFSVREDTKGKNLQRFRVAENGLSGFADFFDLIGLSASEWHRATLQRAIDRAQRDRSVMAPNEFWRLIAGINSKITELELSLGRIVDDFQLFDVEVVQSLSPIEDMKLVSKIGNQLKNKIYERKADECLALLGQFRSFLYDSQRGVPGLAKRYSSSLLFHATKGTRKELFLSKVRSEFMTEWNAYSRSKQADQKPHWLDGSKVRRPQFICANQDSWNTEFFVFAPELVWEAIKVTLQNVVHSKNKISSPWVTDGSVQADMWIRLEQLEHYLQIDFANGVSEEDSIELGPKDCYRDLVSLGGVVDQPYVGDGIVTVRLKIPMMSRSLATRRIT